MANENQTDDYCLKLEAISREIKDVENKICELKKSDFSKNRIGKRFIKLLEKCLNSAKKVIEEVVSGD